MSLKCRLKTQLEGSRRFTEGLLSGFRSPQDWTHQVHPRANHALWFAGHMGVSDNFFISVLDPSRTRSMPVFEEKFGMGSQPVNDPAQYPPPEDVVSYMRDRRSVLLELLDAMTDEDLAQPNPPGTPDFLRDRGGVFETAIWHEGLHSGQVSVAHRNLGNKPLFTPG